jgi:hypothetical protein
VGYIILDSTYILILGMASHAASHVDNLDHRGFTTLPVYAPKPEYSVSEEIPF